MGQRAGMQSLRRIAFAALALLAFSPLAEALTPRPEPIGLGDTVPDVTLRTIDGEELKLRELLAEQPAVLVFYRGGWCPYCVRHLAALAEIEDELKSSGHRLLAISPDRPEKLRAKAELAQSPFTLLSDSPAAAIRAFRIAFKVPDDLVAKYKGEYGIDLEADPGETHHLLPHPAVYVVEKDGLVRFAHVEPDYKKRLEPAKILAALKAE